MNHFFGWILFSKASDNEIPPPSYPPTHTHATSSTSMSDSYSRENFQVGLSALIITSFFLLLNFFYKYQTDFKARLNAASLQREVTTLQTTSTLMEKNFTTFQMTSTLMEGKVAALEAKLSSQEVDGLEARYEKNMRHVTLFDDVNQKKSLQMSRLSKVLGEQLSLPGDKKATESELGGDIQMKTTLIEASHSAFKSKAKDLEETMLGDNAIKIPDAALPKQLSLDLTTLRPDFDDHISKPTEFCTAMKKEFDQFKKDVFTELEQIKNSLNVSTATLPLSINSE